MGTAGIIGDTGTLGGSSLASWTEIQVLVVLYVVVVATMWVLGSAAPGDRRPIGALARVGRGLTRTTGIPGWAAVAIGQSLYGLLVAGVGFYSDVAWHVALGRDDELLTAPHTGILLGLLGILGGAVLGTVVATVDRVEHGFRLGALRVPWSLLPLGALGLGAVSGFPLDEVWHAAYGVDVTMWSPTHMLMILGASFTGLAGWLILAEAGARPHTGRWATGLHVVASWLTLQGLVASQGEYAFGVPQFSHLFHPLLISMAAGLGLVSIRLVLGRGWLAGVAAFTFLTMVLMGGSNDTGPVETRQGATFVASALLVELLALVLGTERRLRFAVASGVAIGTGGLAAEWAWNQRAYQPWHTAMLPEAVAWSVVGAVGTAILGLGVARAFRHVPQGRRVPVAAYAVAAVLAVVPVLALLPRRVGDVQVETRLELVDGGERALVHAQLTPADAADDAYWFQASSWQGGGLVLADMVEEGPGRWVSEDAVPVTGLWKTLLRLHRGDELMAVPIWFPSDPEIDEPEIAAVDRRGPFGAEKDYLLRETHAGNAWLSPVVHGYLAGVLLLWFAAFVVAVRRLAGGAAVAAEPPVSPGPLVSGRAGGR